MNTTSSQKPKPWSSLPFPFLFCGLLGYIPVTLVSQKGEPAAKFPSFKEQRLALVKQFDANRDGRLDQSERETMRLATHKKDSSSSSPWKIPEKFLAKYDKNKNGEMDPEEWGVAWALETQILTKKFDANANGSLEKNEIGAMMKAVSENVITGVPAFFAMRMAGDTQNNRSDKEASPQPWASFDTDGDGYANAQELQALRQSLKKK